VFVTIVRGQMMGSLDGLSYRAGGQQNERSHAEE